MPEQAVIKKRTESSPNGAGKRIIPGIAVVLVLLGFYVYLCAAVNPERVLPKTRASYPGAGTVELSGLDREGVLYALEEDVRTRLDETSLSVRADGETYSVPVGDALSLELPTIADEALAPSTVPFLCRGLGRLRSLVTWRELIIHPTVEKEALLRESIRESGLSDLDTTVYPTYKVKNKKLVIHKGKSGRRVDEDALVQQLTNAVRTAAFDAVVECPMQDGDVNQMDWSEVEKHVCRKSENATLKLSEDRRTYEVVDPVQGISFDRTQAQQALEAAAEESDVFVDLQYQEPELSAKELKKVLFRDKLGTYTTKVSGTRDRISNVRLAAEKCDGVILCQGDEFSYNQTLGERTRENGFKKAGAYLNGATVQELGGGICQISSTLYAACLDANLKIVERHNHTFASSYIGLGMDATVSWGGPDYKFQNDKDYPIRIDASYSGGKAVVSIWGTRTDKLTVEMVSKTEKVIPYPTVTRKSSSIKKGKTRVAQKGSDGYRVQTYRRVYDDGKLVSEEKEAYSVYTPHEQIVYKGTKGEKHAKSKKNSQDSKSKKDKKNSKSKKGKKDSKSKKDKKDKKDSKSKKNKKESKSKKNKKESKKKKKESKSKKEKKSKKDKKKKKSKKKK